MTREVYEVLYEHLNIPNKIKIENKYKTTDRNHFIEWIGKRVAINSIWDYTLRMIEESFVIYSKDKNVISYYLEK